MSPHATETHAADTHAAGAPVVHEDPRHPLYLGNWKRSSKEDVQHFVHDDFDEPHRKRQKAILAKHPEVRDLYGNEPLTAVIGLAVTVVQFAVAYAVGCVWKDMHWAAIVAIAYAVGGTISALFGVIIHEAGHNLVFKRPLLNRLTGMMVNTPMVVPISQSFRRYHLEHHQFQGVEGMDPDLPLDSEIKLIHNNPLLKTLWVFCYSVMYVARGAAMKKKPQRWELINLWAMLMVDVLIVKFWSVRSLAYLAVSVFFGYGMHPGAAHFIQEHYIFRDGQETYSYYGSGNIFYLNIGLHNEHHDFPQIPWTRIWKLRRIATEFYDPLFAHTSWVYVIYKFIASPMLGPQSRLVRMYKAHLSGRKEYRVPLDDDAASAKKKPLLSASGRKNVKSKMH
ncbi:sphingolipid delta-4 desaturase [Coemansia sp. RSA 1722]|nr:sphingolipid delta-4 desaturase [Coemansia sp. RSA 1722]KAJ2602945.1 sphingolipid delta-4 desaturase [Coemansia sp. RSA 1721]KAJ2640021.1 sphingolipid delta-4 desaturase [Coemansia sp. RSA 1286]KAJ2707410.1 sphingolipid delta-4 desaturase [Coemansia sp. IMI 203386]